MTTEPSQSSFPVAPGSRPSGRRSWLRRRVPRRWSDNWVAPLQQQGATLVGWFFMAVGVIGLVGATVETVRGDHPLLARVTSSKVSADETVVVTRVALPDGRVGVIKSHDRYPVSSFVKVVWQGDGNAYEEYAPIDRWVGPGIAVGAGVLLVGVSRVTRRPARTSGTDSQPPRAGGDA